MSKHLLVTGAAGFIGANFVHYWAKAHPEDKLVAFDALTYAGNMANLSSLRDNNNFSFVQGNICDETAVLSTMREHKIDTIVHFAAESHVDRSITGPDEFIETNIVGTHTLLKAAREIWLSADTPVAHRFHHVSTDEVYGSLAVDAPGFFEDQKYEPNSPYSASKAASDHLVRAYHHTYGLQVTTSNCSNNYGPFHFPEKLVPLCLTNILRGLPLPVYGDGSNIRDWLYVEDHCRGIELVLQSGEIGETYNIGGNNEWTNLAIVELLCDQLDAYFANDKTLAERFPEFVEDRAGHDWRYAIDASKVMDELGYLPRESFETGLKKTLEWYLNNEQWWRPLL
ncbi:UNVERIFIED_CONTAM: hypothetical protein GTU68_058297 [Idotea baltica]|nr:hypothetical protein [Idotea baltica]